MTIARLYFVFRPFGAAEFFVRANPQLARGLYSCAAPRLAELFASGIARLRARGLAATMEVLSGGGCPYTIGDCPAR
jgi:hypothetical protein